MRTSGRAPAYESECRPDDSRTDALAAAPGDWRLLTARGLLHEAAGEIPAAKDLYLEAVRLAPAAEDPLGRLFVVLQEEGQTFRLDELLATAHTANPRSVKVLNWMALNYIPLGRYGEAIQRLEQARKLAPLDEGTLTNLGGTYQKIGDHDRAVDAYTLALTEAPADGRLLQNLGLAELSRGNLPEARAAMEAALESIQSVQLHNLLAEVYRRSGLKEQATAQLLASYALDPSQPGLETTLTHLLGHPPE